MCKRGAEHEPSRHASNQLGDDYNIQYGKEGLESVIAVTG